MARSIVHTRAAHDDLAGIWGYTFETWGERQAHQYLDLIEAEIHRIAEDPDRGRLCRQISDRYRSTTVGRHVVYFSFDAERIMIVRVLHVAMDPDHWLG